MSINQRVRKAFDATRELKLPDANVKPVLKNLLKVYDRNWELIEADNYRLLFDAYFELNNEKEEQEDTDKQGQNDDDDNIRPYKKLHIGTFDAGDAFRMNDAWRSTKEDKNGVIEVKKEKVESDSLSQAEKTNKGKDHMLSPSVSFSKSSKAIKSQDTRHARLPIHESGPSNSRENVSIENLSQRAKPTSGTSEPYSSHNKNLIVGSRVPDLPSTANGVKQIVRDQKRAFRCITDIAKGTEGLMISLVDTAGTEEMPMFTYIPQNLVYQDAYVHISLARISEDDCCSSCIGDCLLASVSCACARETGGEFAYTEDGLLKEKFLDACISMKKEPHRHPFSFYYCKDCPLEKIKSEAVPKKCRGHLIKKFIKECWRKCGCEMRCGNRIVQRGITCKLQVYSTQEGKGWGVRTLQDLPKGAFVCEYVGEIVTNMELHGRIMQRTGNERHTYPVYLDADWGSEKILNDDEALCLDATRCGNVARFINHRCEDANLIEIPVEIETPDRHYYHIAFFTTRAVCAMEELTWDYSIDFGDRLHPIKAFHCCCGSKFCRDNPQKAGKVKHGDKSANKTHQSKKIRSCILDEY